MFRNSEISNSFKIKNSKLRIATKNFVAGFTAVELMIVLAIMGIMLVAAIPSFVQFTRNSRIKSGAQMVVSALRTARSHAIKRRKNCMVIFNMDTSNVGYAVKIYWEPDPDVTGSVTNWKTLPKTIIMTGSNLSSREVSFPHDLNSTQDVECVIFKPTGAAFSDGEIQVSDDNKINHDTSYIKIQMITGRIKTSRTP